LSEYSRAAPAEPLTDVRLDRHLELEFVRIPPGAQFLEVVDTHDSSSSKRRADRFRPIS
jgi:hypothetical protein